MTSAPWIVLLAVLLCAPTWADTLAIVQVPRGEILLLTEACGTPESRIQRAVKRASGERMEGCWSVNARGNPVIMWGDGRVQEVAESRVRLAPKYAAMLDEQPALGGTGAAARSDTTGRTAAPPSGDAGGGSTAASPAATASVDFPRASWCKDARFPHEKLVCRDPELAAADLALAPLWRSYRDELKLTAVQQGRAKSEYFRRLKDCGASKPCIQREQAAQARFYRQSLPQR
ncbi:hypothetical protein [Piscinibacter sp. XHJ-5]|uniref:hypothetical protein n=1 Tax=Piscinibacter sp. XHJ-5 TaxID=3037797 RepID=UPI002452C4B4|nr:hypothetical protein [Piscinibacter sp. XHJ-5]